MTEDKIYIEFNIHFNWPLGKTSFAGFGINEKIAENKLKAVVAVKEKDADEPMTFTEFSKGPVEISQISKVISENSSKGRYLTGNFFIIEIYNKDDKVIKGTRIDVNKEKPAHATGPTSVDRNYFLEI